MNLYTGKIITLIFSIILCLGSTMSVAQNYVQTTVTVSKDKVRGKDGKVYYSHVVQDKQTLYSISKAYGVSIDDICNANKELNIKENELKKNFIILIPIKSSSVDLQGVNSNNDNSGTEQYFIHKVKWYEDLWSIAKKYGVKTDEILRLNKLTTTKLQRKMELKIPKSSMSFANSLDKGDNKTEKEVKDTVIKATGRGAGLLDKILNRKKNQVNVVLLLPFNATGKPAESNLDFYCGTLMALKDLAGDSIKTDISVYDIAGTKLPLTSERLRNSDLIIGPISSQDIRRVMSLNTDNTPVISPLEHGVEALMKNYSSIVQAPVSFSTQYKDLAEWASSDLKSTDKIILISESSPKDASIRNVVQDVLGKHNVHYTNYTYNILSGRKVINDIGPLMTASGKNRVIIASNSEAFVNDVVRNLNLLLHQKSDIVIYAPSKILSFETIEVENLHNLNLHTSVSYFIDYQSPKVQKFVREYRALYHTEPSKFAFRGYDIAYYAITACSNYGSRWIKKLPSIEKKEMLQSDFVFSESPSGGYINVGVRRVEYERDYTIKKL